jgi:hypothetical protein
MFCNCPIKLITIVVIVTLLRMISDSSGRYDMVVDSLSNQFKQNITSDLKYSVNSLAVDWFTFYLHTSKGVYNFFPSANFFVQVKVIVIYDSIIKELLNSPP